MFFFLFFFGQFSGLVDFFLLPLFYIRHCRHDLHTSFLLSQINFERDAFCPAFGRRALSLYRVLIIYHFSMQFMKIFTIYEHFGRKFSFLLLSCFKFLNTYSYPSLNEINKICYYII